MKHVFFTGVCTALVTPFLNGVVNYPMMEQLLKRQMEAGIQAVVICGTTGESPTLSDSEKLELFHRAKKYTGDRCLIIAGTGSNNTEHTLSLSKAAEQVGVDGLLVVSPYYNKATPDGLVTHYSAVASSVHIPVIAYNVPSRTGVDIPISVYQCLAQIPNMAGVKEASTDLSKFSRIRAVCPEQFAVWCGNDDLTAASIALGGCGVISVLSNLMPEETRSLTLSALDGDFDTATDLQIRLQPLIDALFSEVNPIPIKAAMKLMGYDCGECRLPLTPASQATVKKLKKLLLQN